MEAGSSSAFIAVSVVTLMASTLYALLSIKNSESNNSKSFTIIASNLRGGDFNLFQNGWPVGSIYP